MPSCGAYRAIAMNATKPHPTNIPMVAGNATPIPAMSQIATIVAVSIAPVSVEIAMSVSSVLVTDDTMIDPPTMLRTHRHVHRACVPAVSFPMSSLYATRSTFAERQDATSCNPDAYADCRTVVTSTSSARNAIGTRMETQSRNVPAGHYLRGERGIGFLANSRA